MITKVKTADRGEWLSLRARYIGGSDAASVIGLNPYKSPYTLWAEKTGRIAPFDGNVTTRVGTYLEQLVAAMYTEETGNKVRNEQRTFLNDAYPWACANIDRMIVRQRAGLEIKTTNDRMKIKQLREGEIPHDWQCQMTHYLAVTDLERWDLAALCGSRELVILSLERDEEDIHALMAAEQAFWECVRDEQPPGVDGTQSTSDTLNAMHFTSDEGSQISLEPVSQYLTALLQLKAEKKALEERIRMAENAVKEYMGEAEYGTCGNTSVSWKTVSRVTYDTKALCREYPDIMGQYEKCSVSRRFTVKEEK